MIQIHQYISGGLWSIFNLLNCIIKYLPMCISFVYYCCNLLDITEYYQIVVILFIFSWRFGLLEQILR